MVRGARSNGDELDKFIMQNSAIDNSLTKIDITDADNAQIMEIGAGAMSDLMSQAIDNQVSLVPVKTKGKVGRKKTSVVSYVSLSYDSSDESDIRMSLGSSRNRFTPYDKRIMNAVFTLYLAGKRIMSLTEIFCVANGYSNKQPSKRQLEIVERSLRKASRIRIYLDISGELSSNGFVDKQTLVDAGILKDLDDNIARGRFDGRLVPIEIMEVISQKGQRSVSVRIANEPLLVTYNIAKGSLMSIPMNYLSYNITMNDRAISIQDYLMKRVIGYQKGYLESNRILYETILENVPETDEAEETGKNNLDNETNKNRQQRYRDRELIKNLFKSWKDSGLIDSYKEIIGAKQVFKGIDFVATKKLPQDIKLPKMIESDEK